MYLTTEPPLPWKVQDRMYCKMVGIGVEDGINEQLRAMSMQISHVANWTGINITKPIQNEGS